jgi:hypothetical protein
MAGIACLILDRTAVPNGKSSCDELPTLVRLPFPPLDSMTRGSLSAYPKTPNGRKVMQAQANWSIAR